MKKTFQRLSTPMRTLMCCILLTFSTIVQAETGKATEAVKALIERITPGYSNQFTLRQTPSGQQGDAYEISGKRGHIVLQGNNAIALAVAYHHYLREVCDVHLSWCGDRIDLPRRLPAPPQTIRNQVQGKYRVYMNYCTVSYSAAWWDWKRWEREIDFMAMNGINMPLFTVGLEAVWYNTLQKYGFNDLEARSFLTGPGHSAWQWMQNIQSYGGPLSMDWINAHAQLGKQILQRELELGMQPIQQGFSGYVPRELKAKYPQAAIRQQPSWCGFKGSAQLDPTDPLFTAFGRDFLEESKKLFGAHGVYAADPFHESAPPVNTPEYLQAVGKTIHKLFKDFDPQATWAMQGWSLRENIVKAVPKEDLLILDLNGKLSEKENACWGYAVVAGNLHNFGGRINLHGDLRLLASNQYVKANRKSPNVCGSGLFMEGITQNPVYYALAFEMPLHADTVNITSWLRDYAKRRYGGHSKQAEVAWQLLLKGPYAPGTNGTERSSILAARPALNVKKSGPNAGLGIPYPPLSLWQAQQLLLLETPKHFARSDAYRFDVVDLQRQILSNLGQAIHQQARQAFQQQNLQDFKLHSGRFLELMDDVDELLRTREEYSFDKWIADARSHGKTPQEKDQLERDATTLVTIWGPDEVPIIFDYSWREWSGLIAGFYKPRWAFFYQAMADSLAKGKPYTEEGLPQVHGREAFRANSLYREMAELEFAFINKTEKMRHPLTKGDEIAITRKLYAKYKPLADLYYHKTGQQADHIKEEKQYENLGEK